MPSLRFLASAAAASSAAALGLFTVSRKDRSLYAACKSVDKTDNISRTNPSPDEADKKMKKWDYNWDKMAPVKTENKAMGEGAEGQVEGKPTASRTLILIRHGQYVWDPHDPNKRILTELGRKQAAMTGQRLKELGFKYSSVYYSTMPRATETSDIIRKSLPDIPATSCDLMREGAPIKPEPSHNNWKPEAYEFFRDGPRIEAAFRKYFHRAPPTQTEDSVEVLVCHANVIRYFVCRALQLPPEAWLRISLAHASLTMVVCRPSGTVSVKTMGGYEHLPPDMVTFK